MSHKISYFYTRSNRLLFIITGFIFLLSSAGLTAQEVSTAIAEGSCNGSNITPEEGLKKALENARSEAIKQVVGIRIAEETYSRKEEERDKIIDTFSKLSRSTSSGRIIKEEILEQKTEVFANVPFYRVKIKADIAKEKDEPDPAFIVEIVMNKDLFYDGEKLSFTLRASGRCYLYLFNIMSNDSVQLLIPNDYIKDNSFIPEKERQQFEVDLTKLSFTAGLPEGKEKSIEALYAVALKERVDFTSPHLSSDGNGIIKTYSTAITDIQNWLIKIPTVKRTECTKIFEIRKNSTR